jgi:hypothetical protein
MYRLLRADGACRERHAIRCQRTYAKPELLATAPNQVWSWDITVRHEVACSIAPRVISLMEPVLPRTVPWAAKQQGNALY